MTPPKPKQALDLMQSVKQVQIKRGGAEAAASKAAAKDAGTRTAAIISRLIEQSFLFAGQPQERLPDDSRSLERSVAKRFEFTKSLQPLP